MLTRTMQYLRSTRELTLMIEPGTDAQWWVDSSYAVHPDMRNHSGIIMTLGKGVTYSTSCKQKLNTKKSTEAELVPIAGQDIMGQTFSGSTRYAHTYYDHLPRQQEYDSTGGEW